MQLSVLFIIIYLLALAGVSIGQTCPTGTIVTGSYTSAQLASTVTWRTDCTKQTISLTSTFTAAKVGWVSVGWNTAASMTAADIAFAWIDGATQYIYDATNTVYAAPAADTYNYSNASITAKGTTTTLIFDKAWTTTDTSDIPLSPTTTLYLLIAMDTATPTNNLIGNAAKHTAYDLTAINFFQAAAAATSKSAGSTTGAATTGAATTGAAPTGAATTGAATTGAATTGAAPTGVPTGVPTGAPTGAPPTPSAGPSTDSACSAGALFFGQYSNADGSWQLNWAIDCDAAVFSAVMVVQTVGWVSFGLNPSEPTMSGSYLLQASVVDGKVTYLDGYASGHNAPDAAAQSIYLQVNGSSTDSTTTIGFSRSLVPDTDTPIASSGSNLLWAYSATTTNFAEIHTAQAGEAVNFFTGATSQPTNLQLVHGSIMLIAWGFLALAGTFVARYLKNIGHTWYRVHLGLQYSVFILTVIGFIVIVKEVGPVPSDHFASAHGVLGLLIFLGTFAQVALGILSNHMWKPDREGTPAFPDQIHWWLGRTVVLLGVVNVFLGFDLYGYTGVDYAPIIAFAFWIGLVYVLFVGMEIAMGQIHHVHTSEEKTLQDIFEENRVPLISYGIMLFSGIILVSVNLHEVWHNAPPPA